MGNITVYIRQYLQGYACHSDVCRWAFGSVLNSGLMSGSGCSPAHGKTSAVSFTGRQAANKREQTSKLRCFSSIFICILISGFITFPRGWVGGLGEDSDAGTAAQGCMGGVQQRVVRRLLSWPKRHI